MAFGDFGREGFSINSKERVRRGRWFLLAIRSRSASIAPHFFLQQPGGGIFTF